MSHAPSKPSRAGEPPPPFMVYKLANGDVMVATLDVPPFHERRVVVPRAHVAEFKARVAQL